MTSHAEAIADQVKFRREHQILRAILEDFEENLKKFKKTSHYTQSRYSLFEFLWGGVLSHSLRENRPLTNRLRFSFDGFSGLEQKRGGLFGGLRQPHTLTLTAALKEHLNGFKRRPLDGDYRSVVHRLENLLEPFPTLKEERAARYTSVPLRNAAVSPHGESRAEWGRTKTMVSLPLPYKPSIVGSSVTSFLLGGVSRIAIMAALGTTGAPLVAAAVVAGVGAGAVTSYYKNRATIAQEVAQETTFAGRMKARWRGFRKSYSWKQLALNTATSTAGVVGGGALFEAIAENVPMPKLVQDFASAAKSQIDSAVEWTSDKAAIVTASLGDNAGPVRAGVSTFFDSVRDVIGADAPTQTASLEDGTVPETTGTVPDSVQTATPPESQSEIPVRRVQTIAIPANGVFDLPADEPLNRIDQAFSHVVPLTTEEQQAAEMLRQNFADKTAMFTDPAPTSGGANVSDQAMSYVPQDVPVSTTAQDAIAAAAPVPAPTHTVGRGDSLWKLTREYYGLASTDGEGRWDAIAKIVQANPHLAANPSALTVGETLVMPDLDDPNVSAANCNVVGGRLRGGCKLAMS